MYLATEAKYLSNLLYFVFLHEKKNNSHLNNNTEPDKMFFKT